MNTEDKDMLIQKYLEGNASDEESVLVEEMKRKDESFARELADYQKILNGMQGLSMDRFKQELQNWEKAHQAKQGTLASQQLSFSFRKYYRIAGIILLLLISILVILVIQKPSMPTPEELYNQYYEPYEDLIIDHEKDVADTKQQLYLGMDAYKQEKYDQAIMYLETYIQQHSDELSPYLYLGIAYMEIEKMPQAIQKFQNLTSSPEVGQQAQWYMALAYLKEEKVQKSIEILRNIVEVQSAHYKRAEATALLKSLET